MRIMHNGDSEKYEIERVKKPEILPGIHQEEKSAETLKPMDRSSKINELKKRVQSGTYTISPERIAQSVSSYYLS
ncbi:flagellar biosynthesis anti-sigma factor FlgM [Fictibacillus iocasae]|uniref:Flagellar biosynthesis anti-sigma factor FlgM n=1 Tax=Fictibacillus iocasae TaxID=2715437 RepID=A0ABW2NUX3_9BACL